MRQRSPGIGLLRRGVIAGLAVAVLLGAVAYSVQFRHGLGVTGLSRAVPWGLYISQFTFLVGVAASSVLVVLPRHVHGRRDGAELVLVGEALSVAALLEAFTFVLVDLGRPERVLYVLLHPSPTSLMFWDILTLSGYLVVCAAVLAGSLLARPGERGHAPRWLVLVSIPLAVGIHVVTALLYAGLVARGGWMTAILAPKFLATAFASGSALLLLLARALDATGALPVPPTALARLAGILTYALAATLLFAGLEAFTSLYSGLPGGAAHVGHLYLPAAHAEGPAALMLTSTGLGALALGVLLWPALRGRPRLLDLACGAVLLSVYLEKGLVFVPSGFAPSALGADVAYAPSAIEVTVALGIHAGGALLFLALLHQVLARSRAPAAAPAGPPTVATSAAAGPAMAPGAVVG